LVQFGPKELQQIVSVLSSMFNLVLVCSGQGEKGVHQLAKREKHEKQVGKEYM